MFTLSLTHTPSLSLSSYVNQIAPQYSLGVRRTNRQKDRQTNRQTDMEGSMHTKNVHVNKSTEEFFPEISDEQEKAMLRTHLTNNIVYYLYFRSVPVVNIRRDKIVKGYQLLYSYEYYY